MAVDRADVLLGTFHMDSPGQDLIRFEPDDVLARHRQLELEAPLRDHLRSRNEAERLRDTLTWFVLFGLGHVPILRRYLQHSSAHRLVDVGNYL